MARNFEALAWVQTPTGGLSLWRRLEPTLGVDVYEVKLGDEYLMSSLFTVAEEELARIGLAAVAGEGPLDVVVGGLGLGYTAMAALEDDRVGSVAVVDALPAVIGWHEDGLLPDARTLTADPRTRLVHGDFFALATAEGGFDAEGIPPQVHAVLLDVDHTPEHWLAPHHAAFYSVEGLTALADKLHPGGVFALWSDEAPTEAFLATMGEVFTDVDGHLVSFDNPLTGGTSSNGIYVGRRA